MSTTSVVVPEDRVLSPYSGWTREHWLHVARTLIGGYLDTVDPGSSMPRVGDRLPPTPHLETATHYGMEEFFERHLLLAAAWLKGTGITRAEGWKHDLAASCLRAIVPGTSPGGPHEWPPLSPCSAFGNGLAMAILIAPEYFWEPLQPSERRNVGLFLKRLAEHGSHDNNHWYFHLAAVPVLDVCGIAYDREYFEEKWTRLLGWYRGDGWYLDGNNKAYDYYNHWGFHYFNLLLYSTCATWRERHGDAIREATRSFLSTYPLFFGADGSSVPWGRSLLYRHALLAPLVWAEFAGLSPLAPGLARRIASGTLRYFLGDPGNGTLSKDNLLTLGYREPNPNLLETYNDLGSAYWSSTAFIALALPASHPFWVATEEPSPADRGETVLRRIDGPKFLLHQHAGRARLFCFEQPRTSPAWQLGIKYGQQVYDGLLGFGLVGEQGDDPGFNRIGVRREGEPWQFRQSHRCECLHDLFGVCSWPVRPIPSAAPDGDGRVFQCTLPGEALDLHLVFHTSGTGLFLSFAGVCLGSQDDAQAHASFVLPEGLQCGVATPRHVSAIAQLGSEPGRFDQVSVVPEHPEAASHLFGGRGVFPRWESVSAIPPHRVLVFASRAGRLPEAGARVDPHACAARMGAAWREVPIPAFRDALSGFPHCVPDSLGR